MKVKVWQAVTLVFGLALTAAGAVLFFQAQAPAHVSSLTPEDRDVVQAGQRIYIEHCASCHGAELEGQPNWQSRRADGLLPAPPHDASGHTWHHPSDHLIRLTKYGPQAFAGPDYKSEMPAYEGTLSDAQIVAVLSFIQSTGTPEIRRRHDEFEARATQE